MPIFGIRSTTQNSSRKDRDRASRNAHHDNASVRRSLDKHTRRESLDHSHIPRMPRISQEQAITDLFNSINDFFNFLTKLKETFKSDVVRVKRYAKPKDLRFLWDAKVDETDTRRLGPGDALSEPGYRARRKYLKIRLHEAVVVTGYGKTSRDVVVANKLKTTAKEIEEYLHKVAHNYLCVEHLLTELDMLRLLLERNGAHPLTTQIGRRDGERSTIGRSGRDCGRDIEVRVRQSQRDDAIFTNPDPFKRSNAQSGLRSEELELEPTDREELDRSRRTDPNHYPASYQSGRYTTRHDDDHSYSASPWGPLRYQPDDRDDVGYESPYQRIPKPNPSPTGSRWDRRSSVPKPYQSQEAREDDDHDQRSEGSQPYEEEYEDHDRDDYGHEDHQNSHGSVEGAEERSEVEVAPRSGVGGGSEHDGNAGGANDN